MTDTNISYHRFYILSAPCPTLFISTRIYFSFVCAGVHPLSEIFTLALGLTSYLNFVVVFIRRFLSQISGRHLRDLGGSVARARDTELPEAEVFMYMARADHQTAMESSMSG